MGRTHGPILLQKRSMSRVRAISLVIGALVAIAIIVVTVILIHLRSGGDGGGDKNCSTDYIQVDYHIHESLPDEYVTELHIIMDDNHALAPAPTQDTCTVGFYIWNTTVDDPYDLCPVGHTSDCAYFSGTDIVIGVKTSEIDNQDTHRFGVVAHEWYHAFQYGHVGADLYNLQKWLVEGCATLYEVLYVGYKYDDDYLLMRNPSSHADATDVLTNPENHESWENDDNNYTASVFLVLVVVDLLQKDHSIDQADALRILLRDFWTGASQATSAENHFSQTFGFSIEEVYAAIKGQEYTDYFDYNNESRLLSFPYPDIYEIMKTS